MTYRLVDLGVLPVPAHPEPFSVDACIRAGASRIRGVGPKLAEALTGLEEHDIPERVIGFHRALHSEPSKLPRELHGPDRRLNWWHLSYCLQNLPANPFLMPHLRSGTQLGCVIMNPEGTVRAVRIQLDWEHGHNIGGRPSTDGWAWDEHTVFLASDI